MKSETHALDNLVLLAVLLLSSFVLIPAAYCQAFFSGGTSARGPGWPVISGPGANILTPTGTIVFPVLSEKKTESKVPEMRVSDHPVKCQVINYSWPDDQGKDTKLESKTAVSPASGKQIAVFLGTKLVSY